MAQMCVHVFPPSPWPPSKKNTCQTSMICTSDYGWYGYIYIYGLCNHKSSLLDWYECSNYCTSLTHLYVGWLPHRGFWEVLTWNAPLFGFAASWKISRFIVSFLIAVANSATHPNFGHPITSVALTASQCAIFPTFLAWIVQLLFSLLDIFCCSATNQQNPPFCLGGWVP